ncbi:hypothetical protein BCR39DRAFT_522781 [Naematelia encephala]|uniref:F-box domain-containing protein n=1 Tax=Naematelia encephala TaxID=71784 RepID=A0A1Y2BDH9_9TREE|nr:hypothetical protein BCR39DRAFT_522781 [Naematelia encephala]
MIARIESEQGDSPRTMTSPDRTSTSSSLVDLPPEILEQVYLSLNLTDRLALVRTCSTLHAVYKQSATLQYLFTLRTTAYIDVPYLLPPPSIAGPSTAESSPREEEESSDVEMSDSDSDSDRPTYLNSLPSVRRSKSVSKVPVRPVRVGPWSAADKQLSLKEREGRWETLDYAHRRDIKIAGPAGVYELQEGIFLMCDEYAEDAGGEGRRPTSVRLIPLPSADDPDLEHPPVPTKSHKLPFPISDLTMDPIQDLIVVSEHRPVNANPAAQPPTHRYHLLSLSTFQPHPLATLPVLDFPPFSGLALQTRQLLQIMGDTLLVLVSRYNVHWFVAGMAGLNVNSLGNEEEIVVWNWKTGRVLARMAPPENAWFASFALLTPTTFLLTSTSSMSGVHTTEPRSAASIFPPVIQVFSILPDPNRTIVPVQPLASHMLDDTTLRPILVAELELPAFAPDATVVSFEVRPDPPNLPRSDPAAPTLGPSKPFSQNPEKGVLVLEMSVNEPGLDDQDPPDRRVSRSYELFILREMLVEMGKEGEQRLIKARLEDQDGYVPLRPEKVVPWAEWAPTGARLMDISMRRRNWVCSCSGYRFISLTRSPSDTRPEEDEDQHGFVYAPPRQCDLRLLDFSPYGVKRSLPSSPQPEQEGKVSPSSLDPQQDDKLSPSSSQPHQDDNQLSSNSLPQQGNDDADAGGEEDNDWSIEVITARTVLPPCKIWKDEVTSGMPYRDIRRKMGIRANGVMMDDQRVIMVATQGRRNGDWTSLRQEMVVLCL